MKLSYLLMGDGARIATYRVDAKTDLKGIILIVHGMAEHAARYKPFADFFSERGFTVFASDLRGHGKTAEKSELGYLSDNNGFERVVDDQYEFYCHIKQEFPHAAVFLFGHSFGSFIVQRYMQRYGDSLSAAFLSGSAGKNPLSKAGKLVADFIVAVKGRKHISPFLNSLSFGSYNKAIKNAQTPFDWLSRDAAIVQAYNDDPLCGFICTAGFFQDLLRGLNTIYLDAEIKKIPKALPIAFFAGDADPVSNYGKSLIQLKEQYKNAGIESVQLTLYPGARHEILNETNRSQVLDDIAQAFEETLEKIS